MFWGAFMEPNPKGQQANTADFICSTAEGNLSARMHAVYPLAKTADVLKAIAERKVMGKVILRPWPARPPRSRGESSFGIRVELPDVAFAHPAMGCLRAKDRTSDIDREVARALADGKARVQHEAPHHRGSRLRVRWWFEEA